MIESLEIKNFKCFENESTLLKPLTVLSGINGMGKSSFIQSLLLLRQSVLGQDYAPSTSAPILNGPLVNLGYGSDVLNDNAKDGEAITFILAEKGSTRKEFSYDHSTESKALSPRVTPGKLHSDGLFGKNFYYLAAERMGPRTSSLVPNAESNSINGIGNNGEYCAWLLAENEMNAIDNSAILHENELIPNLLMPQVEAWMSGIGQTIQFHVNKHDKMDRVSFGVSFVYGPFEFSGNYRPTNVGFGISFALPVFVAALMLKPGGLLIVENPEAHLHPRGQSVMGRFLSLVAESGVQVIVETHSDHVLNGIRVAAKQGLIEPENVALHFFQKKKDANSTTIVTPTLDKDGRLDSWPEGFFDEWENNLEKLL
ncbi:MAG: AAA family ATPase [Pseudohongiellaceae bacterium]